MRIAVCPGSFDPVTLGHLDVVTRAAGLFDRVYFCAMHNDLKSGGLLSPQQRKTLLEIAAAGLDNVTADCWGGLLVEYARKVGACAVVKGVRNAADLAAELEMAEINRGLYPGLETVLLPARPAYGGISSTLVRTLLAQGKEIENYVPAGVAETLNDWKGR